MTLIADTGFIISRWSKSPARRKWVESYAENLSAPFVTAEAVLIEAGYRAQMNDLAPRLLADGDFISKLALSDYAEDLLWLLRKYQDQEMDLADACIVKLFELNPDAMILTTDKTDFQIYRTRSGERLRCDFGPKV